MILLYLLNVFFLLLFKHSGLHFPATTFPHLSHYHLPPSILPSLALSMGPLYMFLDDPFPSFPCYLPLRSLLVTVHLFFISMSLVIFSLLVCFVDQVPPIGEIIWYFSFTTWLTSLSIILSRSMCALEEGRISFFLSPTQYFIM